MNLIFMRHGEATDNVKEVLSDKEIYWSVLTSKGIDDVKESIKYLPNDIDIIYVSPFPRTIQTAHYVLEKVKNNDVVIDNRLREIYYGKYSGQKNNEELDNIRKNQIDGDYFTSFGDYGENKFDIENRLTSFLIDVFNNNSTSSTVLIISHGSIISYMKRILNLKSKHTEVGKIDVFENVDFSNLNKHYEMLNKLVEKED